MTQLDRTAFVTGGTGFLGRRLVYALQQRGYRVTVLVRSPDKARGLGDVRIVAGDLCDPARLQRSLPRDVDAVFHVAANIDFAAGEQLWRDNVVGTEHMLAAARASRARRFVFTSTAGVWGIDHPCFDERSERRGARTGIRYLQSKQAAEDAVQRAAQQGLSTVILNPGHIVGRSQSGGWDQLFVRLRAGKVAALPPGVASWCEVDALAEAHIAAAESGRPGESYLLGGCDASYQQLAAVAARRLLVAAPGRAPALLVRAAARLDSLRATLSGRPAALSPDLARILCGRMLFSSARAERELGYRGLDLETLVERALPLQDAA